MILLKHSEVLQAFKRRRDLSRGFEGEFFSRWLGQIFLARPSRSAFWMGARPWAGCSLAASLPGISPGWAT